MPSQRRVKAFGLAVLLLVLGVLYITSAARQTQTSDFYAKTQQALQAKQDAEVAQQRDADDVGARLKAAEDAAKKAAAEKGKKVKEAVEGPRVTPTPKSVAGRVKYEDPDADKTRVPGVAGYGGRGDQQRVKQEPETAEDHEVEIELNSILKKSPIIIFSKTFCPFSKKAKQILLKQYKIVPPPYVVELDENPLGEALQRALAKSTGRKTVPNVLINGKSIGGGDDVEELHLKSKLIDTVKTMGGKRISEATKVQIKEKRMEARQW